MTMWKFSGAPEGARYAEEKAKEVGKHYGRSVLDGNHYVGTPKELFAIGVTEVHEGFVPPSNERTAREEAIARAVERDVERELPTLGKEQLQAIKRIVRATLIDSRTWSIVLTTDNVERPS